MRTCRLPHTIHTHASVRWEVPAKFMIRLNVSLGDKGCRLLGLNVTGITQRWSLTYILDRGCRGEAESRDETHQGILIMAVSWKLYHFRRLRGNVRKPRFLPYSLALDIIRCCSGTSNIPFFLGQKHEKQNFVSGGFWRAAVGLEEEILLGITDLSTRLFIFYSMTTV